MAESELQTFLEEAAELSVAGLSDANKLKKDLGLKDEFRVEEPEVLEPTTGSDPAQLSSSVPSGQILQSQPSFVYLQVGDVTRPGLPSTLQTQSRQASLLRKERNRVKCNLCNMLLINEEKFLLAHVQRVHGA